MMCLRTERGLARKNETRWWSSCYYACVYRHRVGKCIRRYTDGRSICVYRVDCTARHGCKCGVGIHTYASNNDRWTNEWMNEWERPICACSSMTYHQWCVYNQHIIIIRETESGAERDNQHTYTHLGIYHPCVMKRDLSLRLKVTHTQCINCNDYHSLEVDIILRTYLTAIYKNRKYHTITYTQKEWQWEQWRVFGARETDRSI